MFGAQADLLAEAVREVVGGSWRVRAELGGDEAPRSTASTARPASSPAPTAAAPAPEGEDGWPTTAPLGSGPAQPSTPRPAPAKKARPAARQSSGARTGATPANRNQPAAAQDEEPEEEPPWDPDYDAPGGSVPTPPPKESTEEQAIRVLTETLGAERIDR
jgi:DNA polymerase-3 subunit gamma/tau